MLSTERQFNKVFITPGSQWGMTWPILLNEIDTNSGAILMSELGR